MFQLLYWKHILPVLKHIAMEAYGGMQSSIYLLTSDLDESEWSAPRSGQFTLREKGPRYWIGKWIKRGRFFFSQNTA